IRSEAHVFESICRSQVPPPTRRIEFMKKLRILLADDHVVMRTGLRALLERQPNLEVVGESENGRETVGLASSLRPDVVVMDVGMPVLNGIEATQTIVTQCPTVAVVILSMHADESYVMRALKAG